MELKFFRIKINQIAKYWFRYGPNKSGFIFGTLICLCRLFPKTDWDLLQRYPETFRKQTLSVNKRFGIWKWEIWKWFRKFVNPKFQKSYIIGKILNLFIFVFFFNFGYTNILKKWFLKISKMIFPNSKINCNASKCKLTPQKPFNCLPQFSKILPEHRLIKLFKLKILNHGIENPLA